LLDVTGGGGANRTHRTFMSDSEKQEALTATNVKRCMHGAPPVTWNDAVTDHLENFLQGMSMATMAHDNCYQIPPPAGPAGENLFASSNRRTPQSAVDAWYSEVNYCNGGPSGFTDGCQSGSGPTGHFTALVWAGVQQIGCAYSNNGQVIGCRYWSGDSLSANTPNMGGAYVSQVGHLSRTEAECQQQVGGGGGGGVPAPASTPPQTTTPPPASSPYGGSGGGGSGGGGSGGSGSPPTTAAPSSGGGSASTSVAGPYANCLSHDECTFTNNCGRRVRARMMCNFRGRRIRRVGVRFPNVPMPLSLNVCSNYCREVETRNR
jgi:hypothetical protein